MKAVLGGILLFAFLCWWLTDSPITCRYDGAGATGDCVIITGTTKRI